MSVQVQKRLFTVEEYHKMAEVGILPERGVELINGEIINMSPIGTKHSAMVDKLVHLLSKKLDEHIVLRIQNPFLANDLSEPEPDISLLKYRADFYDEALPQGKDIVLIIEVADTTLAYDTKVKRALYAKSGVQEYWVIDLNKQRIHAYRQVVENDYQQSEIYKTGDAIQIEYLTVEIDLFKIFK